MALTLALQRKLPGFDLDVSWEATDETVVLFGYSGAGKSMTLQLLAGLAKPDAGRVVLDGATLYDRDARVNVAPQRRPFGYVFQEPALFPHMTVEGNVGYGLHGVSAAEREARIAEAAESFELSALMKRRPAELSGGQRQRVAFARTMVRRPSCLLLDEPFSALDAPVRGEMRELLRQVRARTGVPVVLVTHDLLEAVTMADRMLVYIGGRVVQQGTPEAVLSDPANEHVADLVASRRFLRLPGPTGVPQFVLRGSG